MATYLDVQRQSAIIELERAKAEKDLELTRLKTLQLEQIDLKRESLQRIPELEKTLETTTMQLAQLVRLIVDVDPLREELAATPSLFPTGSASRHDLTRAALSLYLSLVDEPSQTSGPAHDVRDAMHLATGDLNH